MEKEKKKLSPKAKKIINIVVNVVCGIILIFALILAVNIIKSKRKGYDSYTEFFGKAYLAVASDSMSKNIETGKVGSDNFSKGDLIVIKILNGKSEQSSLKVGDIITFKTNQLTQDTNKWLLNTHRIVAIEENAEGYIFTTKGDNKYSVDPGYVTSNDVVGKYVGKAGGIGNVMLFMGSSTGFFVFVVLPTFIIVAIAAANLVVVILREKKAQKAVAEQAQQEVLADERERIRQELLAEMQNQGQTAERDQSDDKEPADNAAAEQEQPASADSDNQTVSDSEDYKGEDSSDGERK